MNNFVLSLALTTHLGFDGNPEAIHPHIQYKMDDKIAGLFVNSENSVSAYYGFKKDYGKNSIDFSLVTGYDAEPLLPYIRISRKVHPNLSLFATPALELYDTGREVERNVGVVIGLEFKN